MKSIKKIIFFSFVALTVSVGFFYTIKNTRSESKIFVANEPAPALVISKHQKQLKLIDDAGEYIRGGNAYFQAGQYEAALELYQKAYMLDPEEKAFTATKIISTYEKVGRYDEAIVIADEIIKTEKLVAYGVQRWTEIRARLLVAKNKTQNQEASSPG